ncbi:MAG: hypothetical protein JW896_12375, partial [Deltaproteobacteria bacterium]|nr:hypothetical protein [Deltaproteobacteria bacterium]
AGSSAPASRATSAEADDKSIPPRINAGFPTKADEEEMMKKKTIKVDFSLVDTEGRRRKIDRRQFTYLTHIPERRCGKERRNADYSGSSEAQRRFADVMANPDYQETKTKRE